MVSRLPRSTGRDPEGFEAFYKDVRGRLLLQTYALTGDLHAAQRAVRDALVVTWHHWSKVSRLDRPEDYVRPLAWTRAQRRSSARWWARQKDLPNDARATLDALGKLTTAQRRVLLLAHLAALPMDDLAREVGITRNQAERELQTATAQFSVHREVASTAVRPLIEQLDAVIGEVRWPRPSIVIRAGSARRRLHTGVGVAAAVALVVVSGSLVTDGGDGARPALASKGLLEGDTPAPRPSAPSVPVEVEADPLVPEALLSADQLGAALPGQWAETETTKNTEGDGLTFACQASRYADMRGIGALVRTFTGTPVKGAPAGTAITAGQSAEASADADAAAATYTTTVGWYAGCQTPRVQLLSTYRVAGVGDEATLMVLRSWNAPVTTQVVGVARTGGLTTTVVSTRTGDTTAPREKDLGTSASLLGQAVTGLCTLPDAGTCTADARLRESSPVPVSGRGNPAMLIEADLPPVPGIDQPWVGSTARKARQNLAATRCDKTEFTGDGFTRTRTRSYLIPEATGLPAEFGLTETVGALPRKQAQQFVDRIRDKLAACPQDDLGTDVERLEQRETGPRDLTAWRLTVEVSENRSVRYLMAVIREGNAVAQLTFIPSDDVSIGPEAFLALADRAQQRLGQIADS
jgi:DNA-directed RNA polymerase specialized sigma24 family protein